MSKDYLEIARVCWDSVKNIHHLPPAVYGMKVAYEKKIKELENEKIIKMARITNFDEYYNLYGRKFRYIERGSGFNIKI